MKNFFRQEVLDLPAYHLDEHKGIKLNQNESPWDIPTGLKAEVIENLLKVPWNRYPLGDPVQLKKKMAKFLNVWPDSLVFANGSNVLVQALVLATAVGGKVLILDPSFGLYEIEARLLQNKIVKVPLNQDFSLPEEILLDTIENEKPNIIFIPNPNAPTGTLFSGTIIRKVIQQASSLVVIDEAYYPFSGTTVLGSLKEYDNLVILRTFSKAYALGGLRLGVMIAEPDVALQVQKCILPFCVNKLTYVAAATVLENREYMERYVKDICKERDRVYVEMLKIKNLKVHPSSANFILFQTENSQVIFKKLLDEGVIVRNVTDGRRLNHCLRVTIGTKEENEAFLKALKKVSTS